MKFDEFAFGCPNRSRDGTACIRPRTAMIGCVEASCITFHAAKKIEQSILSKMRVLGKLQYHCHIHDYSLAGAAGIDRKVTFEEED